MLTLYTFHRAFGVFDLSPFVTKAALWLRMAGIEHRCERGDLRRSPTRKFPYIDHDGARVADSSRIIAHCTKAFAVQLDDGMAARERAVARLLQSTLEEHLYFVTLALRWRDPRGWAVIGPEIARFAGQLGVPRPLQSAVAAYVRRGPLARLQGQGLGVSPLSYVEDVGCAIVDACAEMLGDQQYFTAENPRSIDATAFAFFDGTRKVPIENAVRARVRSHANLMAYCDRVESRYFAHERGA